MTAPVDALQCDIAAWLAPDDILLDVPIRDVDHALRLASARIAELHRLDPAPVLRALARREQVGSTGIGQGVAVPHARIAGIERPLVLFTRARSAIEFGAPDGKPVGLILVILVPADGDPEAHLQLLATVAQLFCEREFRLRIAHAPEVSAARAVFAEWIERILHRQVG